MRRAILMWTFLLFWLPTSVILAQIPVIDEQTELAFRARVKQVNQFINRFNNEDQEFSDLYLELLGKRPSREEVIQKLIARGIAPALSTEFIDVIVQDSTSMLSLYDANWFAHAISLVQYKGQEDTLRLSLRLFEDANNKFRWVISGVSAEFLVIKKENNGGFINPTSHETNFIDLSKMFSDKGNGSTFFDPDFHGDDFTLLSEAIANKTLEFIGVIHLEFYFLQLKNWIFSIKDHNDFFTAGGWLINDLKKIDAEGKIAFKRNRLYLNY